MKIISPVTIADDNLDSTNLTEDDYDEWANDVDYVKGDYVISTTTHTVYRCLVAHGSSDTPVDPDVEQVVLADPLIGDTSTIHWQVIGATNLWKLFDRKPSQQCVNEDEITVALVSGSNRPAIGLFGVSASQVDVVITNSAVEVYNETFAMVDTSDVEDWLSYYTSEITEITELVVTDLPIMYPLAEIEISLTRPSGGTVRCGQITVGDLIDIGMSTIDTTGFSGIDFSYVDQDEYGNLTTFQRAATRLANYDVVVRSVSLLSVDQKLRQFRGGVPAVWLGATDTRKAAVTYGFYRSYDTVYMTGDLSYLSIEVQGVV